MATIQYNPRTMEWEPIEKPSPAPAPATTQKAFPIIVPTQAKKPARVPIDRHPFWGYAKMLANHILDQYALEHGETVFRNQQVSYYHEPRKGHHQVVFSYKSLRRSHDEGFVEYKKIMPVWGSPSEFARLIGMRGIWAEVLHECAHALQAKANGFRRGSVHNAVFAQKLQELITLFPYEETRSMYHKQLAEVVLV